MAITLEFWFKLVVVGEMPEIQCTCIITIKCRSNYSHPVWGGGGGGGGGDCPPVPPPLCR